MSFDPMSFDPERADIRFGCGLSPSIAPPASVDQMLRGLQAPDRAAQQFPITPFADLLPKAQDYQVAVRAYRRAKRAGAEAARAAAQAEVRAQRAAMRREATVWFAHTVLRRTRSADPMRERLTAFWADHFTAVGRDAMTRHVQAAYIEEAIRPHVSGRFADLLKSAVTHPMMLIYLDQNTSVGPGSRAARNAKKKKRGLNENLARELLELHTLGVGGPYTQGDVRQLAELLTGLGFDIKDGFGFRPHFAEPGAETVLGKAYGGKKAGLEDIHAVLDDLARHPVTAAHIARKLAVHFISDRPDPALVKAMTARYRDTDGDLHAVYAAMLNHPAAWDFSQRNVKPPIDFVGSALRALDILPKHIPATKERRIRGMLQVPLSLMGQQWGQALGPDGWPEADAEWITPQRLAARLQWAMSVPFLMRRVLPDPRDFVGAALGTTAPEAVRFAASAAESRAEGVGLVLASPAFQRL